MAAHVVSSLTLKLGYRIRDRGICPLLSLSLLRRRQPSLNLFIKTKASSFTRAKEGLKNCCCCLAVRRHCLAGATIDRDPSMFD